MVTFQLFVTGGFPEVRRLGWDCKSAARVLNMHPKKVPQALAPAFLKIAKLFRADPRLTMIEITEALERLEQEEFEARVLPALEARQVGLADRP